MERNVCTDCGTPLQLGEFAYNQEICLCCFKKKVHLIIDDTCTKLYKEILQFLLALTMYSFTVGSNK